MESLKPCPFCGGDADVVDLNDTEGVRVAGFRFAVRCTICGATLECRSALQSKIAWNRREVEHDRSTRDKRIIELAEKIEWYTTDKSIDWLGLIREAIGDGGRG